MSSVQYALKKIGSQYVRSIFKYIPAQIAIERLMQNSYECPCCKKTEHPYIRKAKVPTSFMPHSLASAGSVAEVVTQKYVNSICSINVAINGDCYSRIPLHTTQSRIAGTKLNRINMSRTIT